jgi:hypothetical protein
VIGIFFLSAAALFTARNFDGSQLNLRKVVESQHVTVYHQALASEATEFQNNKSATTAAPTTAPEPKSSPHSLPFCIYVQSRGWGNSILAVFNFWKEL